MKHSVAFKGMDEGFGTSKLGPIDDDPVLARCQMNLASSGSEIADIMRAGNAAGAPKGGEIMGLLAMMSANGQHGAAPVVATGGSGGSAGPAIAAGMGGLALGAAGAAALAGSGSSGKKEDKPKTETPKPGTSTTATTGTTTPTTVSSTTEGKKLTPPPGGSEYVPEPPTKAPVDSSKMCGFDDTEACTVTPKPPTS